MKLVKLIKVALLCVTSSCFASDWTVDNENSNLNFISVKKGNIAEVHSFTDLKGDLAASGNFQLSIDLNSVDTNNPVRDDRMKNFLFKTEQHSHANLSATIEVDQIDALTEGASKRLTIDSSLTLHGIMKTMPIDVIVTRLAGDKLSVVSLKPVIIQAKDFSLAAGIDKLRELASLPSISQAVPVSFYVTLKFKKIK